MKKWIVPIAVIILIAIWGMNVNNKAVGLEETVTKSWANVESSYQRRNDLIGNLVKTVQGAADFEKGTLEAVINARAKATSISIDPSNITPEQLAQFNKVQGGLSGALKSLLVTVERYPELKANQNFLELQSQLEGTENRINVSRDRFNEAVKPYNDYVRKMPTKFIAGLLGFDVKGYYKADVGSENAPDVEFDF
ncbi:MAG: LemA family protein [Winogradskyella sp.]|uniref:LemA family protein n=1 Tax=Winogradskyella sp. TaxID=1883156 RepID=UPI00183A996B|nr:LemA family protein [Winogradskyella sp.]MBT8244534.1 LemA family protein [Winogradskyella sp.]NNK23677.1 LemA family protein [Winogradskyella sp.]